MFASRQRIKLAERSGGKSPEDRQGMLLCDLAWRSLSLAEKSATSKAANGFALLCQAMQAECAYACEQMKWYRACILTPLGFHLCQDKVRPHDQVIDDDVIL